ncbi:hypothetical protein GF339_18100 [candidate division KSB3 bacterium]|uniref:Uncharacterized protein n=1 Tax=candidate division KSB3 bacterium TaxID=2044937 RepID=A0A9D5Q7N9_9BACT|nr:hypothetical protein [candidate division KSB3 bacterium]MBD3326502.1 hypothetical protein [candidate division KSB3 bacterium]
MLKQLKIMFMMGAIITLLLLGAQPLIAQTAEQPSLGQIPGVALSPLQFLNADQAEVPLLCVINTRNEGPQWFLLNAEIGHEHLGPFSASPAVIQELSVSPDGRYAAIIAVDEGQPVFEVIDFPLLMQEKTYRVLQKLDPYPGVVEIRRWEGDQVYIASTMLLTHANQTGERNASELDLSWPEVFSLDVRTGEIRGVSEGAKNPVDHYLQVLTDPSVSEDQKDAALAKLLLFEEEKLTLAHLLTILEQEQNPKRILKILKKMDELRQ